MSRRKRAPNTPRIGTVFELVGDDAVDEFKAVCAAYGLAPKELVHKLVTENIAGLREDPFRGSLVERGIEVSDVDDLPWGRFVYFSDPDGNSWALQQIVVPDLGSLTRPGSGAGG